MVSAAIHSPADLILVIEERRKQRNLTARALCKAANASHSAYWYSLERAGDMTLSKALSYLDALDIGLCVVDRPQQQSASVE